MGGSVWLTRSRWWVELGGEDGSFRGPAVASGDAVGLHGSGREEAADWSDRRGHQRVGVDHNDAILAGFLRVVHRSVGDGDELRSGPPRAWRDGGADRECDIEGAEAKCAADRADLT